MSRTKALLLLLCLCLSAQPALAESESLISSEMIRAETANYDTYSVERGVYEKIGSSSTTEYYPHIYNLRYEVSGAKFGEYLVKRGDEVKAGDPLAVFTLDHDEVGLAAKRQSLLRAQEQLAAQTLSRQKAIEDMREDMAELQDPLELELAQLRILRAEIALEQYIYQQELNIAGIQESIDEIEEELSNNLLLAPTDGVIDNLVYKRVGDRVSTSEVLVTLYRTDDMLLRIDNTNGYFRYGMQVNVEVGSNNNRTVLTGQVVAADNLVPENIRINYAFIRLDPYDPEIRLIRPSAKGQTYYLENVLLVPRRSVTLEQGKYYVSKLSDDGTVQKRFVSFIMSNNTHAWVLQGLEAGETIIID